ncbi:MAG: antitoxin MazE family protein [Candidatus Sulfotelmatobacter sp.]
MAGFRSSSKLKVRKHREQLRRQGLRPLQIWVPDVLSPSFRTAARKQSKAVAERERADDLAFIAAVSDLDIGRDRD